jgi:hypothetical protein
VIEWRPYESRDPCSINYSKEILIAILRLGRGKDKEGCSLRSRIRGSRKVDIVRYNSLILLKTRFWVEERLCAAPGMVVLPHVLIVLGDNKNILKAS